MLALLAKPRQRRAKLCLSEVWTIMVGFHLSGYRTVKEDYRPEVVAPQRPYFPTLVSYNRLIELPPGALVPWCGFRVTRFGPCRGISFIDSTQLSVCHHRRSWSPKVMAKFAARGKTSVDWFYGFKVPRVINDQGGMTGGQDYRRQGRCP